MTAKEHYDSHLASIYFWMPGDFETGKNDQKNWFKNIGLHPQSNAVAYTWDADTACSLSP